MKQRLVCVLLLSMLLALTGCQSQFQRDEGSVPEESAAASQEDASATTADEADESDVVEIAPQVLEADYSPYQRLLSEETFDDTTGIVLKDVDGDDVAELFVSDGEYHAAGVDVYTICDGEAKRVLHTGELGRMFASSQCGILAGFHFGMGAGTEDFYTFLDGNVEELISCEYYNGMDSPAQIEGTCISSLKINGVRTTLDPYNRMARALSETPVSCVSYANSILLEDGALELLGTNPQALMVAQKEAGRLSPKVFAPEELSDDAQANWK